MYYHDALFARRDDVLRSPTGMVPVPRVESKSDVGAALLGEFEHLVHLPDELVAAALAQLQRSQELESQAAVRTREHIRDLGETRLEGAPEFVFGRVGGWRNVSHHARASDSGT